jgi:hypothetical protein
MVQLFNHYTVLRSKISAIFTSSASFPVKFGLMVSGSSSYNTNWQSDIQNGNVIYGVTAASTSSAPSLKLTSRVDMRKFQGVDDIMDVATLSGDSSSNPTEMAYYHCMFWNPASSSIVTGTLDVVIDFDTMWTEPRKPVMPTLRRPKPIGDDPSMDYLVASTSDLVLEEKKGYCIPS